MVARTITLLVLVLVYPRWDPNESQKPNSCLYQAKTPPTKNTTPIRPLSPPPLFAPPYGPITLTWYDYGDANPNTACNIPLDPTSFTAAAPISWSLPCFYPIIICTHSACVRTTINDRIPTSSSSRYNDHIIDVTPAVLTALSIPHGRTANGTAYGRATVELR